MIPDILPSLGMRIHRILRSMEGFAEAQADGRPWGSMTDRLLEIWPEDFLFHESIHRPRGEKSLGTPLAQWFREACYFMPEDELERRVIPSLLRYGKRCNEESGTDHPTLDFARAAKDYADFLRRIQVLASDEVRAHLFSLGFHQGELACACIARRLPTFPQLLKTDPQLAWAAAIEWQQSRGLAQIVERSQPRGALALAAALEYTEQRIGRKVLRRLSLKALREHHLLALHAVLGNYDFAHRLLNLRIAIHPNCIALFHRVQVLPSAPLLRSINEELLRPDTDRLRPGQMLEANFENSARMLQHLGEPRNRLARLTSARRLRDLHRHLFEEIHGPEREGEDDLWPNPEAFTVAAPFPSPVWLKPVRTLDSLVEVADRFRNCALNYSGKVKHGDYYFFVMTASDIEAEALVGFRREMDGWVLDQFEGHSSQPPHPLLDKRLHHWINSVGEIL